MSAERIRMRRIQTGNFIEIIRVPDVTCLAEEAMQKVDHPHWLPAVRHIWGKHR